MSIDGYSAGPNQSLDNPLGVSGGEVMDWAFHTRLFREMHGEAGGETGADNDVAKRGFENIGARGSSDATCSDPCAGRG